MVALVKAMAVAATKAAMAVAGRVAATEVAAVTAAEMAERVRGSKDREVAEPAALSSRLK